MGDFKQHTILGLVIMAVLYIVLRDKLPELNSINLITLGIITILYSNMPDCDQPGSIMAGIVLIAFGLFAIYSFLNHYTGIAIILIGSIIFFRIVHHRTLVHSVFFALLLSAPLLFIGWIYFMAGLISYVVHISSEGELSLFTEGDWRALNIWR